MASKWDRLKKIPYDIPFRQRLQLAVQNHSIRLEIEKERRSKEAVVDMLLSFMVNSIDRDGWKNYPNFMSSLTFDELGDWADEKELEAAINEIITNEGYRCTITASKHPLAEYEFIILDLSSESRI